ncbi:hypothetical protein EDD21DRAFT_146182 [Dissophora ornata]|nr:hypothetical protein EDD21DRAFT_146182 [Dissophora ornata]
MAEPFLFFIFFISFLSLMFFILSREPPLLPVVHLYRGSRKCPVCIFIYLSILATKLFFFYFFLFGLSPSRDPSQARTLHNTLFFPCVHFLLFSRVRQIQSESKRDMSSQEEAVPWVWLGSRTLAEHVNGGFPESLASVLGSCLI